jgi:hypothetical protein
MGLYLHAAADISAPSRTQAYKEFIDWTLTFKDVYWVNNQQLLAWIKNPTDVHASITAQSLDCVMPATAPENTEICDGVDNTGNGEIDAGLASQCYYPGIEISFTSCFGCPPQAPSLDNPVPVAANGSSKFVPADGCPNNGSWDPAKGTCVYLARAKKGPTQTELEAESNNKDGKGPSKSEAPSTGKTSGVLIAMSAFVSLIISSISLVF